MKQYAKQALFILAVIAAARVVQDTVSLPQSISKYLP